MKQLYLEIEQTYCNPKNYPPVGGKPYTGHQSNIIAWNYLGTESRMTRFATLMDQARTAVAHADAMYQQRVELFDKSTWSYMVAGRQYYQRYKTAPIPSFTAARVPEPAVTWPGWTRRKRYRSVTNGTTAVESNPPRVHSKAKSAMMEPISTSS